MVNIEGIKQNAVWSFKDDIKIIDGFQWVPVSDARAAIAFAISDTIAAVESEQKNEVANLVETLDMVKESLKNAKAYNLEVEVMGFALIALKKDPTLTISQALETALIEWDV